MRNTGQGKFKKENKILVIAAVGYGNTGDEAVFSQVKNKFEKIGSISVFSGNPEETKKMHNTVAYKPDIKLALQHDMFIIGGGGIFHKKDTLHFLFWALIGKLSGKKVIIYSVGVVPDITLIERVLLFFILNIVDYISVRDEYSKILLQEMGIIKNINIIPDPGISIKPIKKTKAISILNKYSLDVKKKKYVGISVKYTKNNAVNKNLLKTFSLFCDWVILKYGVEVVFFTMCMRPALHENDLLFAKDLYKMMKNKSKYHIINQHSPAETKAMIGEMCLFIGTRLHSIIFSHTMNIPVFGIIYQPKIASYLKSNSIEGIDIEKVDLSILEKFVNGYAPACIHSSTI